MVMVFAYSVGCQPVPGNRVSNHHLNSSSPEDPPVTVILRILRARSICEPRGKGKAGDKDLSDNDKDQIRVPGRDDPADRNRDEDKFP
jgi:hypothetical protein